MKVSLFGGSGFVGSYIIDTMKLHGYVPRVLIREKSNLKVHNDCEIVSGNIFNEKAIEETIKGTSAIIYNIGIIREFPKKEITFHSLHIVGLEKCIKIAKKLNIKRFILMSANGVKEDGTEYQKTKWIGEKILRESNLEWTIFRPSLIFGDPRGENRPEFCTQLRDNMLRLPLPAPLFFKGISSKNIGNFSMSPIHVLNVAEFFVKSIKMFDTINGIYPLGGIENVNWIEIIDRISLASNIKKWKLPTPIFPIKLAAFIFERYAWFPITMDQILMLIDGNIVEEQYFEEFQIIPKKFSGKNLKYLIQER